MHNQTGCNGVMDLSGTANRLRWPRPLTDRPSSDDLHRIAARFYGCEPRMLHPLRDICDVLALLPPPIRPRGRAALDRFRASLRGGDCGLTGGAGTQALHGAALAVVMNPGTPEGRNYSPAQIADLARQTGHLIVDERYADPRPDLSIIRALPANVTALRDLSPFWGLPVAFAITHLAPLRPGDPAFSPAPMPGRDDLCLAAMALADCDWTRGMISWLAESALHLDQIMIRQGARLVGGTHFFRLYEVKEARAMQAHLARHRITPHLMAHHPHWLRLALPANRAEFRRLRMVLA